MKSLIVQGLMQGKGYKSIEIAEGNDFMHHLVGWKFYLIFLLANAILHTSIFLFNKLGAV